MRKIQALLRLPRFVDPYQDRAARLLNNLVWLTVGIFTVRWIAVLLFDPRDLGRAPRSVLILAAISIVIVVLLHRRQLRTAALLFVVQYWLVITVAAITGGGMATPAVAGFPVVALAAGLVIGWRAASSHATSWMRHPRPVRRNSSGAARIRVRRPRGLPRGRADCSRRGPRGAARLPRRAHPPGPAGSRGR